MEQDPKTPSRALPRTPHHRVRDPARWMQTQTWTDVRSPTQTPRIQPRPGPTRQHIRSSTSLHELPPDHRTRRPAYTIHIRGTTTHGHQATNVREKRDSTVPGNTEAERIKGKQQTSLDETARMRQVPSANLDIDVPALRQAKHLIYSGCFFLPFTGMKHQKLRISPRGFWHFKGASLNKETHVLGLIMVSSGYTLQATNQITQEKKKAPGAPR